MVIKIIYKILSLITDLLFGNINQNIPTERETELIEELKFNIKSFSTLSEKLSEIEKVWFEYKNELIHLINTQDPRNFLRWDVIKQTMFVGNVQYIKNELNFLKDYNWNIQWKKAIKESWIGCPKPYIFYPKSSPNLIHQAYHVAQFEYFSKEKVSELDFILEFGGGYGSMCYLFYNIDFKGKYYIFDIPIFSALQVFYLKMSGLNTELGITDTNSINCISEVAQLKKIMDNSHKKSMFIATWSISETPVERRKIILNFLGSFDVILIAYASDFENVNNILFFKKIIENMKNYRWHNKEIKHLPGNYYLLGEK